MLVRPVLSPPCSTMPLPGRALIVRSKPFQCSICLPKLSANVVMLSTAPTLFGIHLVQPADHLPALLQTGIDRCRDAVGGEVGGTDRAVVDNREVAYHRRK